ncbi:MAG: citrate synthase [Gammaproteobacteria bacterium]|nr:citrate synthase [Gammaproteobacteria bacterium]
MEKNIKTEHRKEIFSKKIPTRLCKELPSDDNPYLAKSIRYHGYELNDILENCNFVETFFLLFYGEFPDKNQSEILEKLMIGLINPGPRHPATRAAMYSSVSKTNPGNVLPIGLSIMSGSHGGAGDVESSMRFIRKNMRQSPQETANRLSELLPENSKEDLVIAPGFGQLYQSADPITSSISKMILALEGAGEALRWANEFAVVIQPYNMGWLKSGLAAAVFCDLGFQPKAGVGLYQLLTAPGILAHGLEVANKKLNSMPFPGDENYVFE